jgi:hypothetical protein
MGALYKLILRFAALAQRNAKGDSGQKATANQSTVSATAFHTEYSIFYSSILGMKN